MNKTTAMHAAAPVVPVYTVTLLLSAFLLFAVQPMFGKMILPLLGGSPSVWNTAMLFFQMLLLAGYAYAHGIARFMSIRAQALLHTVLLAAFAFVLPVAVPEGWLPPEGKDPTFWQLMLMTAAVGGPFFVISASAPLLQHWFAHTGHEDAHNPYFLYAASNLGSMTALLSYPFLIEPMLEIGAQSLNWAYGYGILILLVVVSAFLMRGGDDKTHTVRQGAAAETITWGRRGMWLLLAFVPSSLMLGVTTFITTDLASVPLLWILPLALYVTTFIIAFGKKPRISRLAAIIMQTFLLVLLLSLEICLIPLDAVYLMPLHVLLFFFCALMCHHELAALRPHAGHLTQFYLIMSTGGALGGLFNAIIAPNLFTSPFEYAVALILAAFMRFSSEEKAGFSARTEKIRQISEKGMKEFFLASGLPAIVAIAFMSAASFHFVPQPRMLLLTGILTFIILLHIVRGRWVFGLCALAIFVFHPPGKNLEKILLENTLHRDRNFFGILKVGDSSTDPIRLLLHGTTIHGAQPVEEEHRLTRLSYYSEDSGVSEAFAMAGREAGPQKVGVIGLGIGVAACFRKEERHFDFFEIDPAVVEVAEDPELFTYLSDCGSPYEIILGDGRLKIGEKPDGYYDIVFLDVFSSDNIPVHVITLEAVEVYKNKLKADGFIIMNISNRFMTLRPVVAAAAQELGMQAFVKYRTAGILEESGLKYNGSEYAVLTNNKRYISYLREKEWEELDASKDAELWTDQFSDIVSVFKIFRK